MNCFAWLCGVVVESNGPPLRIRFVAFQNASNISVIFSSGLRATRHEPIKPGRSGSGHPASDCGRGIATNQPRLPTTFIDRVLDEPRW